MQYVRNFLCDGEAQQLLEWTLDSPAMTWQRERYAMFGREGVVPRRLAWFGDVGVNYRYSGLGGK